MVSKKDMLKLKKPKKVKEWGRYNLYLNKKDVENCRGVIHNYDLSLSRIMSLFIIKIYQNPGKAFELLLNEPEENIKEELIEA